MLKKIISKLQKKILFLTVLSASLVILVSTVFAYPASGTWSYLTWVGYGYEEVGNNVKAVQAICNASGCPAGAVDGYYGTNTRNGIKSYQASKSISSDGIVGSQTWQVMHSYLMYSYNQDFGLGMSEIDYYPGGNRPKFLLVNSNYPYDSAWCYWDIDKWIYLNRQ